MVFAIVAAMFIIIIAISYWREIAAKKAVAPATSAELTEESASHFYLHPSHTFARVTDDGLVEVGMDDFAKHAFGKTDQLELPAVNQNVQQGDQAWRATIGERTVTQRIPVDGQIVETSGSGESWILKIKPSNLQKNLVNLIDSVSVVNWLKMARIKFLMQYSGTLVPAKQDGGELVEGFARYLTDEQWDHFVREFFNSGN
ncbi:hypothetical protein JXO59_16755 [candidate division KSB1 bacterium]|nr:hypothetical protein [candidate division KSB1 bacterium]